MTDVVLVVDMLRGFLEEGNNLYCGDDARGIIPSVQTPLGEGDCPRLQDILHMRHPRA